MHLPTGPYLLDYTLVSGAFAREDSIASYEKSLAELTSVVCKTISSGGNALVPVQSTGIVYDILENLCKSFEKAGNSKPHGIYLVSPGSIKTIQYANISGEWLRDAYSEKLLIPEDPMHVFELMEAKRFKSFDEVAAGLGEQIKRPSVVFTGHPSLRFGDVVSFLSAWKDNAKDSLILPEYFGPLEYLLAPFEHMAMKVFNIPCRISCNQYEIADLLSQNPSKHVLVPSDFDLPKWKSVASNQTYSYDINNVVELNENSPTFIPSIISEQVISKRCLVVINLTVSHIELIEFETFKYGEIC